MNLVSSFWWKCLDCLKNKTLHSFRIISPNGMNQIFHVDKSIFYEKQNFEVFILTFCDFLLCSLANYFLSLVWHHSCSWSPIELKIILLVGSNNVFSYLQKMFQKIKSELAIIGNYPNLVKSPRGTFRRNANMWV